MNTTATVLALLLQFVRTIGAAATGSVTIPGAPGTSVVSSGGLGFALSGSSCANGPYCGGGLAVTTTSTQIVGNNAAANSGAGGSGAANYATATGAAGGNDGRNCS